MAKCDVCKKEMMNDRTLSCTERWLVMTTTVQDENGQHADVVMKRADVYLDEERRCHDCNVGYGGYHHTGCDWERCPFCGGQLITCDCEFVIMSREDVMATAELLITGATTEADYGKEKAQN